MCRKYLSLQSFENSSQYRYLLKCQTTEKVLLLFALNTALNFLLILVSYMKWITPRYWNKFVNNLLKTLTTNVLSKVFPSLKVNTQVNSAPEVSTTTLYMFSLLYALLNLCVMFSGICSPALLVTDNMAADGVGLPVTLQMRVVVPPLFAISSDEKSTRFGEPSVEDF